MLILCKTERKCVQAIPLRQKKLRYLSYAEISFWEEYYLKGNSHVKYFTLLYLEFRSLVNIL